MMKNIIIYGTGHYADIVFNLITKRLHRKVSYFTVDRKYMTDSHYNGVPIIAFDTIENNLNTGDYCIVIAFIGNEMFNIRAQKFIDAKSKGFILENIIHDSVIIETEDIGEGNIILANTYIGPFCSVGDGNIFWQNVVIPHHNSIGNFSHFAPSVSLSGYSVIKDNCFLGNNSVVSNHVVIDNHSLVGACSFVKKNTSPYEVIVPRKSIVLENKISTDFQI